MMNLVKITYDNRTEIITIEDVKYKFKEGESKKLFPVEITGDIYSDLYDPVDSISIYYQYNDIYNRFEEAENYFNSLELDLKNINYFELQKYNKIIYRN